VKFILYVLFLKPVVLYVTSVDLIIRQMEAGEGNVLVVVTCLFAVA
jgi:hypothetical protein